MAVEIRELRAAWASGEKVEIVVTSCAYACCGKRFFARLGYEQTYCGEIVRLEWADGTWVFELHSIAVSSLNYAVSSQLEHLVDLALVD